MKTGKLLVVLQTWSGDLAQADALARLVTDLTLHSNAGQFSPHADFMLCVRWDTEIPMATARYCQKAFQNVHLFRTRARVSGWPQGPNAMASEAFQYYVGKQRDKVWRYSGIFLIEPDSVPLTVDCLARIHREWSNTPKPVLGCVVGAFPGGKEWAGTQHTNGNCVLSEAIWNIDPTFLTHPCPIAWDAHHRRLMVTHTQPSMTIFSDYRLGEVDKNPWRDCDHLWRPIEHFDNHPLKGVSFRPAWLHGPKDARALACVRERLLQPTSLTAK